MKQEGKSTAHKLPILDYVFSHSVHSVRGGTVQAWDDNYEQQLVEYAGC